MIGFILEITFATTILVNVLELILNIVCICIMN